MARAIRSRKPDRAVVAAELDLADGERGSRPAHVDALLAEPTGAPRARGGNNCPEAQLRPAAAGAGGARARVVATAASDRAPRRMVRDMQCLSARDLGFHEVRGHAWTLLA